MPTSQKIAIDSRRLVQIWLIHRGIGWVFAVVGQARVLLGSCARMRAISELVLDGLDAVLG